jgi:hypothetical protein
MFERPARKTSFEDFARVLHEKGEILASRIEKGSGTESQHRVLTHIIGIERWAQSRVAVALGQPFKQEEYTNYRPARTTEWSDLLPLFRATRAESVALAEQLAAQNVPTNLKVKHNQYGDLSVRAWLQYMVGHADFESKRIAR